MTIIHLRRTAEPGKVFVARCGEVDEHLRQKRIPEANDWRVCEMSAKIKIKTYSKSLTIILRDSCNDLS